MEACAKLEVPELSQIHVGLALEPQQAAEVNAIARAAADLLRPGAPVRHNVSPVDGFIAQETNVFENTTAPKAPLRHLSGSMTYSVGRAALG